MKPRWTAVASMMCFLALLGCSHSRLVTLSQTEVDSWIKFRGNAPFLRGNTAVESLALVRSTADEAVRIGLDKTPNTRVELLQIDASWAYGALRAKASNEIQISAAEIDSRVQALAGLTGKPKRYRLRTLLLRIPPESPASERAAIRSKLTTLQARARAGESFAQLAGLYSQSETRWTDGLLGNVDPTGYQSALGDVIRSLKPGDTSDIIQTEQGLVLLHCDRILPPVTPTPEAVRQAAKNQLFKNYQHLAWTQLDSQLDQRAGASIDWVSLDSEDTSADSIVAHYENGALTLAELAALLEKDPQAIGRSGRAAALRRFIHFARLQSAVSYADEAGLMLSPQQLGSLAWERKQLLSSSFIAHQIDQTWETPKEADFEAWYLQKASQYRREQTYHLGLIRMTMEDQDRAQVIKRAYAAMDSVHQRESSFEEAARRLSDHPSADQGGWIAPLTVAEMPSVLGIDLTRAATKIELQEVSVPIVTPEAVWIMTLRQIEPPGMLTYTEARRSVRRDVLAERVQKTRDRLISKWLRSLDIQVNSN